MLGLAGLLWISADLRDEWRTLDPIEETVHEASTRSNRRSPPNASISSIQGSDDDGRGALLGSSATAP